MLKQILQFVFGLAHVSPSPENRAAWLTAPGAWPFTVGDAPYPTPLPHEVVVQTGAVAINPVDWKVQQGYRFELKYPHILGEDIAGNVVEVGSAVESFKVGDRVIAYAQGLGTRSSRNGAFQLYAAVPSVLATKVPDALAFTEAVVLPLGIATAASGLFQKNYLELPLPVAKSANSTGTPASNRVVLIWGGSSSVGTSAIQLAVAAGIRVATTASPHNHGYVKELGAEWAFDYRSKSVIPDVIAALEGLDFVGVYDAIGGEETLNDAVEIIKGLSPDSSAKVVTVDGSKNTVQDGVRILGFSAATIGSNEVGSAIFNKFLPAAIESGQILPKPDPWIIAHDLEGIQKGVDESKQGVSAKKVVIQLGANAASSPAEL